MKNISTSYTLSRYKEISGSASGFNDSKNVGINQVWNPYDYEAAFCEAQL